MNINKDYIVFGEPSLMTVFWKMIFNKLAGSTTDDAVQINMRENKMLQPDSEEKRELITFWWH